MVHTRTGSHSWTGSEAEPDTDGNAVTDPGNTENVVAGSFSQTSTSQEKRGQRRLAKPDSFSENYWDNSTPLWSLTKEGEIKTPLHQLKQRSVNSNNVVDSSNK